ncbi:hypothetical protein SAMN05444008_11277 [Cnuella takakiae]|uniref:Uncharacterized protein n=1 Tax=Cnuella takakiae TaxID=1302690 RepID=A0A1M5EJX4_9BACT|nr:hypothetical protein [Cnuella takakiae]OLY91203.1 hypothetical protein BUE76_04285 [Cnuella takakiae]SHF79539.1 hypothetical protein SAMN05444008_11277 [Cnuella takakiae]
MHTILPYQFNCLDICEQIATTEKHGVCLDVARYEGSHKIGLFDLWGYYVEVWVDSRSEKVVKLYAFQNMARLDRFLIPIPLVF